MASPIHMGEVHVTVVAFRRRRRGFRRVTEVCLSITGPAWNDHGEPRWFAVNDAWHRSLLADVKVDLT